MGSTPDGSKQAATLRTGAVVVGAVTSLGRRSGALAGRALPLLAPVARVALSPPLVPDHLQPRRQLERLAERGAVEQTELRTRLRQALDRFVPLVVEELVRRVPLTATVTRYVDLDAVVAAVDLDAAVARVDVDAVVGRADLAAAVARVDVDAVARRLDVDAVARRLDVDAVLDRLDLTRLVLERVDLDAVLQAVLDRLDLAAIAVEVIDEIDLPEIIRESTGSMASDTVRGARMQGIAADEAVARLRNRLLSRRAGRPTGGIPAQGARAP